MGGVVILMSCYENDSIAGRALKRRRLTVPTQTINQFDNVENSQLNPSRPSIHCLSEECLLQILSYLTAYDLISLQIICKRWFKRWFNACQNAISLLKVITTGNHDVIHWWQYLIKILGLNFANSFHKCQNPWQIFFTSDVLYKKFMAKFFRPGMTLRIRD